jgi:nucleoside-diphosphate-sugar epimerase
MKETDLCEPKEVYGLTKLAATLSGKMIADTKKKPIVTFRFFTPYGPYVQKGKLVEQVIENARAGKDINLTRPTVSRDFIYIDDLVALLLNAAENIEKVKGEILNAGSGQKNTLKEFVDLVIELTGSKSKVVLEPEKASIYDSDFWQADMTATFESFSWRPKVSLRDGLEKTVEYFKNL